MPVKFDDISKTATEVLNDDYQTKGYNFKAKQKTNWDGAVITTAVDVGPGLPAKMTWKLPAPLGFSQICIDKLEFDKSGKYKLECSSDNLCPASGVKLEAKSDLVDLAKTKIGVTYTAVKDCRINFEASATDPSDFVADVTYATGDVTLGTKFNMGNITGPDIGARYSNGPLFASLYAKGSFSAFTSHLHYKVSPELKCAATVDYGGKTSGNFTVGCAYDVQKGTKLKAKVSQDQSLSLTVKHELAKGFTVLAGTKYQTQDGKMDCGLQLSIE